MDMGGKKIFLRKKIGKRRKKKEKFGILYRIVIKKKKLKKNLKYYNSAVGRNKFFLSFLVEKAIQGIGNKIFL